MTDITPADLRQHYAKTGLARLGIPFERAMTIETVRIALAGAVRAQRRLAARQAEAGLAIHHNQIQEAA